MLYVPPLRRVQLFVTVGPARILSLRTKLRDAWLGDETVAGQTVSTESARRAAEAASKLLNVDHSVLTTTLQSHTGRRFDAVFCADLSLKLSGGSDWMRTWARPLHATLVPPSETERAYLVVMAAHAVTAPEPVVYLEFLILSGSMAGHRFKRRFTTRFMKLLARDVAFSYRRPWRGNPNELALMWLEADLCASKYGLTFDHYTSPLPSKLLSHNRRLVANRNSPCLRGYFWPCSTCPLGYDQCPRGTHAETYPRRACHIGGVLEPDHDGFFEPGHVGQVCMECRFRHGAARKPGVNEHSTKTWNVTVAGAVQPGP